MIVVDTSVWIDHFRARATPQTTKLRALFGTTPIVVGDVVLAEILCGARSDADALRLETLLAQFDDGAMLTPVLARQAAKHYRTMRAAGFTVTKLGDLLIGTYCIETGCELLHNDADFLPMARHCGLRMVAC